MAELPDYEAQKKERRKLSGQKKRVVNAYVNAVQNQDSSFIETLKDNFLETLETEKRIYDYIGVETSYYPIFFDNIFHALGFGIYRGTMPTVSGIQPDQPFHVAFDASRIILIRSFPSTLFSEIADVQSLSSKPVLGISHTTWVRDQKTDVKWEHKYTNISTALGIGRLQIDSSELLKDGIKLDPEEDKEKLKQIAKQIGLIDFLSLPVDNLPLYGSFRIGERNEIFDEKNVKKMLLGSIKRGHQLAIGAITAVEPMKALEDPSDLVRQLNKCDLLEGIDKIHITPLWEK